jgi:hypothetical protein
MARQATAGKKLSALTGGEFDKQKEKLSLRTPCHCGDFLQQENEPQGDQLLRKKP